jgi:hypothetical protein
MRTVDPHAAINGQLEQLEVVAAQADTATGPTIILGELQHAVATEGDSTRESFSSRVVTAHRIRVERPTLRGAGLRMHADWIFTRGVKIERWGVARP